MKTILILGLLVALSGCATVGSGPCSNPPVGLSDGALRALAAECAYEEAVREEDWRRAVAGFAAGAQAFSNAQSQAFERAYPTPQIPSTTTCRVNTFGNLVCTHE